MPIDVLQSFVVLPANRVHEIAVATVDPFGAPTTATRLAGALPGGGSPLEVVPWMELNPALAEYVALGDSVYGIIVTFVFGIAIFGVANSMLMATYERRREVAVMLALGATPRSVWAVVLSEAFTIGLFSLALGAVLTFPLMVWFHNAPPDMRWLYGDLALNGALLRPSLRVEYDFAFAGFTAVSLLVTVVLAALYPALRAGRTPPADTLSGL